MLGDRGNDSDTHEAMADWLGVEHVFAQRGTLHGSGLGKDRYVVERTITAVHRTRRRKVRYQKRSDIHPAFLTLACVKLC